MIDRTGQVWQMTQFAAVFLIIGPPRNLHHADIWYHPIKWIFTTFTYSSQDMSETTDSKLDTNSFVSRII
jgi:hypothetical protein